MYVKIRDMRLLNVIVKKDNEIIYEGKVEDAPEEIKNLTYKKIEFDMGKVLLEI